MKNSKLKLATAVLASALLAACSSTQTDDSASDAAAQAAADRAAAERAAAERAAAERAAAEAAALQTVFYFDFDQSTLRPETRAALDAQIARLKASNVAVRLEGHADERGTREYNMALGERRANAVANYMSLNGVARGRIETVSYGEERPVDSASNEGAWSQNRRVELK
jgi:peptidoglycan-associated lipoprotein